MERADKLIVFPFAGLWRDVGRWSWNAAAQLAEPDVDGNPPTARCSVPIIIGRATKIFMLAVSRPVVALGTQKLTFVDTPDALLVLDPSHAEAVKALVSKLEVRDPSRAVQHRRVLHPRGWYDTNDLGAGYHVKRIMVKPAASLSLQMHHHSAEHWVVVSGTAEVTNGERVMRLGENQSNYIPIRQMHRLANPGLMPLEIIEVQSRE